MKIFITGGTGFIGKILTEKLVTDGHQVTLLVRDPGKVKNIFLAPVKMIPGDLQDNEALHKGMQDCDLVFHLAAYAKPWSKDPAMPFKTNVTGSVNVFESALRNGVQRVVFTSTAGSLGYSAGGEQLTEDKNNRGSYFTDYERTKARAEDIASEYFMRGLPVVTVNPSRVYGPGFLNTSNSVTRMIKLYMEGKWHFIPGDGNATGNYVFIEDVVNGHILASEKGKPGQRYILGGENISFNELFRLMGEVTGRENRMIKIPAVLLKGIGAGMGWISKYSGSPAVITKEWADKFLSSAILSSNKAIKELDYKITTFKEGLYRTIMWLKSE